MALTKIGATLGGSADVTTVTQSSHGLLLGYPVKMTSSGYAHATANTTANAEAVGIVIASDWNGSSGANTTFTLASSGRITTNGCVPNLTAGTVLFLQVSAGLLAAAEPSSVNQVSKPMAVVTVADSEMIMIQQRGEVIGTSTTTIADDSITSAKIVDGAIVNADVNTSAAVAFSKLADLADGNILVGNGSNVATSVNPSGDIDVSNTGAFTIANDAVTTDKLANSINTEITANTAKVTNATHTGDVTGSTALTIAAGAVDMAMLATTAGTAGSGTFLRGDGQWQAATSAFIGVRVENSSSQSIGNNSATIIVFDAAVTQFDTDTMHSPSADTKITFTTAGKYWVGLSYAWAGNSTGRRNIWVSKNNSATIFRQTILPSTADEAHDGFGFIYEFAAADYIYFYGHQTSGGALNLVADNESATVAMAYKID